MTKKDKELNSFDTKGLVIFKDKEDAQGKVTDVYSFEKVDQEDRIKLGVDFRPHGSHFLYSILIDNQSLAPVTEMKVKIRFPKFIRLTRSFPPTMPINNIVSEEDSDQIILEFDELNENSNKEIHLYFSPNSLDVSGEIRTIVTYVNNKDTIRVLDSRPAKITVNKITIEPKVVPSSFIREFSQKPDNKKVFKSIGVGIDHQVQSEIYFEILEQIFLIHKFQLVAKDVDKMILWFFGTESFIKVDILAIGQIVSNKIEIIALSSNHYLLISFLTETANHFKEYLISNGIITSKDKFYDLECKNCGAVLPYFPNKNESIVCKNCTYKQIIW